MFVDATHPPTHSLSLTHCHSLTRCPSLLKERRAATKNFSTQSHSKSLKVTQSHRRRCIVVVAVLLFVRSFVRSLLFAVRSLLFAVRSLLFVGFFFFFFFFFFVALFAGSPRAALSVCCLVASSSSSLLLLLLPRCSLLCRYSVHCVVKVIRCSVVALSLRCPLFVVRCALFGAVRCCCAVAPLCRCVVRSCSLLVATALLFVRCRCAVRGGVGELGS